MKMDVYSFGMLCMWILFKENKRYPKDGIATSLDGLTIADGLKNVSQDLAQDLVRTAEDLDDQKIYKLDTFFKLTLAIDPQARTSNFKKLLQLLTPDK